MADNFRQQKTGLAGAGQAADDMVRVIANGLTFGGADKLASALGEQDTAARTAAARDRTGLAGDLATVVGYGGGGKAALAGLKFLPKVLPAAVAAHPVRSVLGALGLAAATGYENTKRVSAATPAPTAAAPKAAAPAKSAAKPDLDALTAKITGLLSDHVAAAQANPTFSDVAGNISREQGGISLRQLDALGEALQRGSTADYYAGGGARKQDAPGDAAGRYLEQMYTTQFQKALQDPKADQQAAADEYEKKVLQLRKSQFIDPYGLHDDGAP